jgi:hypothetical protein
MAISSKFLQVDFCIVGGGMAGVSAALAAARNGLRVALVQNRSVLGGNASSEIRMHIVGADFHGRKVGTRETGLIEELRIEDAYRNPHRSYSQWDLLLYEKIFLEPKITLYLDTECLDCHVKKTASGARICDVTARRNSTEEEFIITAPFFADCSGDGFLGAQAGATYRMGREAGSEFGESLAPEKADKKTLGSSILFMAREHSQAQTFLPPSWVRRFSASDFKHRPIPSFEFGYWWFEWGGHLDTIVDNPAIRHECLRIALGVWDYVKNSGAYPAADRWALDWVGAIPGKRESRRFQGPYTLTQEDVFGGRLFPDTVAYGGWPIDLHPPAGIDAPEEEPCAQHDFDNLFGIPLRALHSINIDNLFFAGRNISATHVAFASTRVMATCALMGQAVGTAAAVFVAANPGDSSLISNLSTPEHLRLIQLALLRADAFLPGVDPKDPADLALRAKVSADSESPRQPAANVQGAVTRHLRKEWGAWSSDRRAGWFSAMLPASLHLEWDQPQKLKTLQLVFDSGLERELILSASDFTTKKVIRGPQPEIVRDYTLFADGHALVEIKDNFQRLRTHTWPEGISVRRLEIRIHSTHGVPEARIMTVRAYSRNLLSGEA